MKPVDKNDGFQRTVAKALRYASRLIEFESSSYLSNKRVAKYLEQKLVKHGILVERLAYDDPVGIRKHCLVAKKGSGTGGMAWFGHMDTVPAPRWNAAGNGPFEPLVTEGRLYGRGSCDMKGPIACFLAAANSIPDNSLNSPLYIVLTADEETGFAGARCVVEESRYFREIVSQSVVGVIGEPTMLQVVHSHKGSIMLTVRSHGVAAHSSTKAGSSSNWSMISFLTVLNEIRQQAESDPAWQNRLFDPPGLSINVCLSDNSPAINVTSSESICQIYLRSMPGMNMEPLLERIRSAADQSGLEFEIPRMAPPMFTEPNSQFVMSALQLCGQSQAGTVAYGTDGAVMGEMADLIVCGPGSIEQAHTVNEWISLDQMHQGTVLYRKMIERWCHVTDEQENA